MGATSSTQMTDVEHADTNLTADRDKQIIATSQARSLKNEQLVQLAARIETKLMTQFESHLNNQLNVYTSQISFLAEKAQASARHIQRLESEVRLLRARCFPPKTFPSFKFLPKEIRLAVWNLAMPGPRIVAVEVRKLSCPTPVFSDYSGYPDAAAEIEAYLHRKGMLGCSTGYPFQYCKVLELYDCKRSIIQTNVNSRASPSVSWDPYNEPNVLAFKQHVAQGFPPTPIAGKRWIVRKFYERHFAHINCEYRLNTTLRGSKVPPLLHVCRESRIEALSKYAFCLGVEPTDRAVTFRSWPNFPDPAIASNEVVPHSAMASKGVLFQPAQDIIFFDHYNDIQCLLDRRVPSELQSHNIKFLAIAWTFNRTNPVTTNRLWGSYFLTGYDKARETNQFPNVKSVQLVVSAEEPLITMHPSALQDMVTTVIEHFKNDWTGFYQGQKTPLLPPEVTSVLRGPFLATMEHYNDLAHYPLL